MTQMLVMLCCGQDERFWYVDKCRTRVSIIARVEAVARALIAGMEADRARLIDAPAPSTRVVGLRGVAAAGSYAYHLIGGADRLVWVVGVGCDARVQFY